MRAHSYRMPDADGAARAAGAGGRGLAAGSPQDGTRLGRTVMAAAATGTPRREAYLGVGLESRHDGGSGAAVVQIEGVGLLAAGRYTDRDAFDMAVLLRYDVASASWRLTPNGRVELPLAADIRRRASSP